MSKLKTPREKKLASLAMDCRNVYGENDKASRKGIPRSKQTSHQALRRAAKMPLHNLTSGLEEDVLVAVESAVLEREIVGNRKSFKKRHDVSLGNLLENRKTGDWKLLRGYK